MSSDSTASPSCSRSLSHLTLPPFLRLTAPQESVGSSNRLGGYRLNIKSLGRTFHHLVFPRESGTGNCLVPGATVEDENAVCVTRTAKLTKRRTTGHHASKPSTTSITSQSTASHTCTSRSPRTLITSFPPLSVSDLPPRSPTNKSPFSATLLPGGDEEREEDNPALVFWHTEQVHRARLAKLTRHLGEEVPAELVLSPVFLSRGTCSSIHSHRGGHHYRHKSLDPSSSMQKSCVAGSTGGSLRRSKSLMERGDSRCTLTLSETGFTPKTPSAEYFASGVCNPETTIHIESMHPAPLPCTTPRACHSTHPMNISNGDVLHERVSMCTYFISSSPPPDETAGPAPALSLSASRTPPEPTALPRRCATADPGRRIEKLENFFGVTYDDLSARGTAQTLQCSSANATGDLAIGIHARESQLEVEVEVKVIKPVRFWNSRATAQSMRPGDVIEQLRMMKAS